MMTGKAALIMTALLLGGCLSSNGGAGPDTASDSGGSHRRDRDEEKSGKPRQLCESTLVGGEPKTICY